MKLFDSKWICAFLIVLAFGSTACFAQRSDRSDRTRDRRQLREEKLKQQEQQAKDYLKDVENQLDDYIKAYNELNFPSQQQVEEAKKALFKGKKSLRYLSREDKAKAILLDSWLSFYGGDAKRAMLESGKAYAMDPLNGDSWATHVIFSVLQGKTPKPKIRPRPPRRGEKQKEMIPPNLEFYMDDEVVRLNGKRVEGISQVFADSQIESDYAAVLFWKIPEFDEEEFAKEISNLKLEDAERKARQRQQEIDAITKQIQAELTAFSQLGIAGNTGEIIFAAVNINSEEKRQQALEFVKANSAKDEEMTKIALGMNTSSVDLPGDLRLLRDQQTPVMVIVSRSQIIEYAGSSRGPLAKLVIEKVVPGVSFKTQSKSSKKDMDFNPMMDTLPTKSKENVSDSNSLPEDSKTQDSKKKQSNTKSKKNKQYRQLTPEEEVQAQRILQKAQMFRGSHTRLGQSRRVVEACREVIEKYPGTIYEEQAKEILRSVPERHRKKLGITEEEIQ